MKRKRENTNNNNIEYYDKYRIFPVQAKFAL